MFWKLPFDLIFVIIPVLGVTAILTGNDAGLGLYQTRDLLVTNPGAFFWVNLYVSPYTLLVGFLIGYLDLDFAKLFGEVPPESARTKSQKSWRVFAAVVASIVIFWLGFTYPLPDAKPPVTLLARLKEWCTMPMWAYLLFGLSCAQLDDFGEFCIGKYFAWASREPRRAAAP